MVAPQRRSGSRFTLAILLLTSVTLISLDARGYEPLSNLRKAATAVIQPFRNIASTVFDPVADAWESLSEGDTLEKENALLREQLSELLEYRVTTEGAVEELAALRTQLDLENLGGQETIVAAGKEVEATRFLLDSDIDVTLWYDEAGRWLKLAFEARGQDIEYVLTKPY